MVYLISPGEGTSYLSSEAPIGKPLTLVNDVTFKGSLTGEQTFRKGTIVMKLHRKDLNYFYPNSMSFDCKNFNYVFIVLSQVTEETDQYYTTDNNDFDLEPTKSELSSEKNRIDLALTLNRDINITSLLDSKYQRDFRAYVVKAVDGFISVIIYRRVNSRLVEVSGKHYTFNSFNKRLITVEDLGMTNILKLLKILNT